MRLIDDWKKAHRLNSVRLIALLFVLDAAQLLLPFFEFSISPVPFAIIGGLLSVGALLARLTVQKDWKNGRK